MQGKGKPRATGFTHTGYLVNEQEGFEYLVVLTESRYHWQDSKGYRYSKRTGKPIGAVVKCQPFPFPVTLRQVEPAV